MTKLWFISLNNQAEAVQIYGFIAHNTSAPLNFTNGYDLSGLRNDQALMKSQSPKISRKGTNFRPIKKKTKYFQKLLSSGIFNKVLDQSQKI